jgi:hypothetical protein
VKDEGRGVKGEGQRFCKQSRSLVNKTLTWDHNQTRFTSHGLDKRAGDLVPIIVRRYGTKIALRQVIRPFEDVYIKIMQVTKRTVPLGAIKYIAVQT